MMKMYAAVIALSMALGAALLGGCDKYDSNRMSQSQNPSRVDSASPSGADESFLSTAAQANLAETDAGRLAEKKAANTDVKRFAQHMIEDHTQANSELMDLAKKKGFQVPRQADDVHQKDVARLSELSGAAFDRAYMNLMVTDHVDAVALFEKNAEEAKDAEVRAFAQKTLPVLRKHLTMARDVSAKVGGSSSP